MSGVIGGVVFFRLALCNPILPEITDGYDTQLHHALGDDLTRRLTYDAARLCLEVPVPGAFD
jgi:hypothetical protein